MDKYQQRLRILNGIRDIAGATSLHLPQICVVGDQSSGKSSVLKLLTGVNFPVDSGTCTKAAIVVECKQSDETYYAIQDESKEYQECDYTFMADRILKEQQNLLYAQSSKISDSEIRVKVSGPECIDIIVVDLPGIINVGDGANETRRLIKEHIKLEQTLILLVSEAKTDQELVTAVDLASEFDADGRRTMQIYTKFDTFDTEDAKSRAIKWVCDSSAHVLGAHAVVAAPGGKSYDSATEEQLLGELGLSADRSGVASLKARLPAIFSKLIETNLPGLKARIENKAHAAKVELARIGEKPIDGMLMLKNVQESLLRKRCPIQSELTPHIQKFQSQIAECKENITTEWTRGKFPANVFVCPFFSGNEAFIESIGQITEWWKPILTEYIEEVEKIVVSFPDYLEASQMMVSDSLIKAVSHCWQKFHENITAEFKQDCFNELGRFNDFGTINHYLTAKYEGEMIVPEALVKEFRDSLTLSDVISLSEPKPSQAAYLEYLEKVKDKLQAKLEDVRSSYEEKFKRKSLHEQQQYRLHAAVIAATNVEEKTFTDMVFKLSTKVMERVIEWARNKLFADDYVRERAVEDPNISERRRVLQDTLQKMNNCLDMISSII